MNGAVYGAKKNTSCSQIINNSIKGNKLLNSSQIKSNYQIVLKKIELAAKANRRAAETVRLVVVSKTQPVEIIKAAIDAGVREFGENYTEEAVAKKAEIGEVNGLKWHMIGHIQSRKAELVARYLDYVHTIDSLRLAIRLDGFAKQYGRKIPVLLECNVGGEITKFGYLAQEMIHWQTIASEARQIELLPNLEISGLMAMPPLFDDPEKSRPYFRKLRELQIYLSKNVPNANWKELSMGTSLDYFIAVEEGATFVRVGTAILGSRHINNNRQTTNN